ncbi:hypothetical protein BDR26DRAFT_855806 [Obelidium mucronatum]|nr:hypothetical protein BDR26DRAFT_855806 [Obelidium mucronatum]
MSSDIGLEVKKALPDLYTQEATHLYLSLYLLEQRSLGKESYWFPYIATLPKAYPTMTVNFSEDEQSLLKESNLYHELYEAPSNLLRDDYNLLCNHMIGFCFDHSFDDYKWARLSVQSRSFSLDIDGVTASALIPYADMFNHGPDHHLYWRYNATTKSAQFCAIRDVEGNVPIFNSYGLLGSRRALEYYGFAIPENPVETALVRLNIPEYLQAERCVKVSGGREALFNRVDYHVVAKADDSEFLNALVMARVCAAQSIQELRELDLFGKIRFLSFWNEWRALEFLEAAIQDALRNFSHDIAADQNLLNDPKLPFNKRNVIIVRLGEKRVLTNLRTVIQDLKLALIIPMGCFSLFVCGVFGYLLLQ